MLAGADFGAGIWHMLPAGRRAAAVREHTHRSMSAVWEANHVWLIFVLVVCWTAYPVAFSSIASTLAVPLLLAGPRTPDLTPCQNRFVRGGLTPYAGDIGVRAVISGEPPEERALTASGILSRTGRVGPSQP